MLAHTRRVAQSYHHHRIEPFQLVASAYTAASAVASPAPRAAVLLIQRATPVEAQEAPGPARDRSHGPAQSPPCHISLW
jgi:hypothetical protein